MCEHLVHIVPFQARSSGVDEMRHVLRKKKIGAGKVVSPRQKFYGNISPPKERDKISA